MSKITTLTDIVLSHNVLSGKVPDLTALSNLLSLDLRENHLDSELPPLPKGVTTVLLSSNTFTGEIPVEFGILNQLQHLDLSNNTLSGTPPADLFRLSSISYLNLASNVLSGSLPNLLHCGGELGFVDISDNRLVGRLPSCLNTVSDKRIVKFGGNCLSLNTQYQHSEGYCKQENSEKKRITGKEIALSAGVIGGILIVVVFLLVVILVFRRKKHARNMVDQHMLPKVVQRSAQPGIPSELLTNARIISQAANIGSQGVPSYRVFSMEELLEATENFDQSALLGEGSVGKFRHPHLVGLLGHCIDGGAPDDSTVPRIFLIYEYVSNGNFRAHLSGVIPSPFSNRLKTSNILLDEHNMAKLSDYGMSILMEESEKAKGDDFTSSHMTKKEDDVYNFGFILLESLVGPTVSGKGEAFLLNEMASFGSQDGRRRIVDPIVLTTSSQESLSIVISITNKCIFPESSTRPSFEDVLWNLQYAAQVQATADADQKSDATSPS
ncbi:hypothetical protein RND71_032545 [Anisodus tanguticus]|uniref:Protein kinase domain-containing protein n=1 Tax=Anisodus tanguticus TaxID=243964 RepID=A0AAE1R7G1_9SOLA|nr:hypothetical protein RND71_032545 [Anisodus tanguticus]